MSLELMIDRGLRPLSNDGFAVGTPPIVVDNIELSPPVDRQYVLRMMIFDPRLQEWSIPREFEWCYPLIYKALRFQYKIADWENRFVYITIRHGVVTSETDDVWHVDGYSLRLPHEPEQNYLWSNCYPTEFCPHSFVIPDDFDGLKHNLHWLLQDMIGEQPKLFVPRPNDLVALDVYNVHRRPVVPVGTQRSMVRVSFVPIQIMSKDCEPNPGFPYELLTQGDIRETLTRYPYKK